MERGLHAHQQPFSDSAHSSQTRAQAGAPQARPSPAEGRDWWSPQPHVHQSQLQRTRVAAASITERLAIAAQGARLGAAVGATGAR